jgi:hypothetical protein
MNNVMGSIVNTMSFDQYFLDECQTMQQQVSKVRGSYVVGWLVVVVKWCVSSLECNIAPCL